MVTITDKAKEKALSLMQEAGLDDSYFLRVSVKGGGCSGLSYNLDFDCKKCGESNSIELKGLVDFFQ